MPDKLIPFMMCAAVSTTVPGSKVNISRIIEAIIIAVICAMGTSYMTTRSLETKMEINEKIRLDDRNLAIRDRVEIKNDIKEVKDIVFDHIIFGKVKAK